MTIVINHCFVILYSLFFSSSSSLTSIIVTQKPLHNASLFISDLILISDNSTQSCSSITLCNLYFSSSSSRSNIIVTQKPSSQRISFNLTFHSLASEKGQQSPTRFQAQAIPSLRVLMLRLVKENVSSLKASPGTLVNRLYFFPILPKHSK